MSYQLISTGNHLNPVTAQNLSSISDPEYSGRLLSISCVAINTCEAKFAEGPYTFYDQFGNTRKLIVNDESLFIGQPVSSKSIGGFRHLDQQQ
jgi:hypothetical protein